MRDEGENEPKMPFGNKSSIIWVAVKDCEIRNCIASPYFEF